MEKLKFAVRVNLPLAFSPSLRSPVASNSMELSFSRVSDSSRILPSLLTAWSAAATSVIFSEKLSGVVLIFTIILVAGARTKAQTLPIIRTMNRAAPKMIHFLRDSKVGIFLTDFSLLSSVSCSSSLESRFSTRFDFDLFAEVKLSFAVSFGSAFLTD